MKIAGLVVVILLVGLACAASQQAERTPTLEGDLAVMRDEKKEAERPVMDTENVIWTPAPSADEKCSECGPSCKPKEYDATLDEPKIGKVPACPQKMRPRACPKEGDSRLPPMHIEKVCEEEPEEPKPVAPCAPLPKPEIEKTTCTPCHEKGGCEEKEMVLVEKKLLEEGKLGPDGKKKKAKSCEKGCAKSDGTECESDGIEEGEPVPCRNDAKPSIQRLPECKADPEGEETPCPVDIEKEKCECKRPVRMSDDDHPKRPKNKYDRRPPAAHVIPVKNIHTPDYCELNADKEDKCDLVACQRCQDKCGKNCIMRGDGLPTEWFCDKENVGFKASDSDICPEWSGDRKSQSEEDDATEAKDFCISQVTKDLNGQPDQCELQTCYNCLNECSPDLCERMNSSPAGYQCSTGKLFMITDVCPDWDGVGSPKPPLVQEDGVSVAKKFS